MNKLKNITISLISAILTILIVLGSYSTFASNAEYWSEFEDSENFMSAKSNYHDAMNDFFNEKFESIYNFLKDDEEFFKSGSATRALLTPPSGDLIAECSTKDAVNEERTEDEKIEDDEFFNCIMKDNICGKTNLSTYCVSMQALQIYFKYIDKLDEIQKELSETNNVDCFHRQTLPIIGVQPTCVNTSSLANLAGGIKERNEAIKAEYDSAKQIMEVTISAYNEFMLAYPMHKKYKNMLKSLTNYKNALKGLSYESMVFPLKFVGTSSYTCS